MPNFPGLNQTTEDDLNDAASRITANSLNTTRVGSIAAAAAGIVAAVSPVFSFTKTESVPVQAALASGKALAVAAAILAVAWVLSADSQARSRTAAAAKTAPAAPANIVAISLPRAFDVHVQNMGNGQAAALRTKSDGSVDFLVMDLPNHGPQWIAEANIG
jgi:hypothetical protein